jgi:hypothetical protein
LEGKGVWVNFLEEGDGIRGGFACAGVCLYEEIVITATKGYYHSERRKGGREKRSGDRIPANRYNAFLLYLRRLLEAISIHSSEYIVF